MDYFNSLWGGSIDPQTGSATGGGSAPVVDSSSGATDDANGWLGGVGATLGSIGDAWAKIESAKNTPKVAQAQATTASATSKWLVGGIIAAVVVVVALVIWKRSR